MLHTIGSFIAYLAKSNQWPEKVRNQRATFHPSINPEIMFLSS